MIKFVLFDFDGTIADSLPVAVEILNKFAEEFKYKKVKDEEIEFLRNRKSKQIMKELRVRFWKVPKIARKVQKEMFKKSRKIKPVNGIKSALNKIKRCGYKLGIITTNSRENVESFLKKNNIVVFDVIYTDVGIFKKKKILRKFVKEAKLSRNDVYYVGDETRDIIAARKANISSIAVTWGLNSKDILKTLKPSAIADTPKELSDIFCAKYK